MCNGGIVNKDNIAYLHNDDVLSIKQEEMIGQLIKMIMNTAPKESDKPIKDFINTSIDNKQSCSPEEIIMSLYEYLNHQIN